MKRFLLALLLPVMAHAQLWSGTIDPARAIDWTSAGVVGGIPDRATQCGSTIAAYSGSPATINNAITACTAGQHVQLGSGTFTLNNGVDFGSKNNVTVRGNGANSTFLVFSSSGDCNGYSTDVTMCGDFNAASQEDNVCNYTAGYTRGATTITLASCGSTTPVKGSIGNLKVGGLVILDQLDESADTGTIWNCADDTNDCANTSQGGFNRTNGTCNGGMCMRSQEQGVTVTSCDGNFTAGHACTSGTNITISPGLYMPNWASGQKPQAFYPTNSRVGVGLENMSLDHTAVGGFGVVMMNCNGCWVKGIRSIKAGRSHIFMVSTMHNAVVDSYFYQSQSHATVSYTIELNNTFDALVQNNISQQVTDSFPNNDGPAAGNVAVYNFAINDIYSGGWMQASFYQHASGDVFNLWEGNVGPGYTADDVHGTHHFETLLRNRLVGNQTAGCTGAGPGLCDLQTVAVHIYAASRYYNILGNVLGQASFTTGYQCSAAITFPSCSGNLQVYTMGYTGNHGDSDSSITGFCLQPACSSHGDYDPQTPNYLFRWGNWDTVTNATRWCGNSSNTGWSTTCSSTSEVPTSIAVYSNSIPATETLPNSFYFSSKPSWFGSVAWPPIGPDVTSGILGVCSGGTYALAYAVSSGQCTGGSLVTALSGHANAIPAMACFLNTMSGPPDGTGSVLAFDASTCYAASSSSGGSVSTGSQVRTGLLVQH